MNTARALDHAIRSVYTYEFETCPHCGGPLIEWGYQSGFKTVLTLTSVLTVAQRPKRCADPLCAWHSQVLKSARWQQLAPHYCTFGYDVIAQIGWERQQQAQQFAAIQTMLRQRLPISEAQVRYLYHQKYLPLVACVARQPRERLTAVARQSGLIWGLEDWPPKGANRHCGWCANCRLT